MAIPTLDRRSLLAGGLALTGGACAQDRRFPFQAAVSPPHHLWTFDRLREIGGHLTRIEGQPRLINSPYGQALEFNGVDDALFIDNHPLAGAEQFTFEALFRPDGGAHAQRWFHLQEAEPATSLGEWPSTRFLFEIRVYEDQWCLDAFAKGPGYSQVLIFPERLYPLGQWAHVAQTYDGIHYRSYVNGELQGQAPMAFVPQMAGASSVGCRFNRVDYFKGAIQAAAFAHQAWEPQHFSLLKEKTPVT